MFAASLPALRKEEQAMGSPKIRPRKTTRGIRLAGLFAAMGITAGWILTTGFEMPGSLARRTVHLGNDRLVSFEPLPEVGGAMCELMPAIAGEELLLALNQSQSGGAAAAASDAQHGAPPPRPSEAEREAVRRRQPLRNITDPLFGFAGITVDLKNNEVIIAEENLSTIVVYDRLENTPPSATMSEPKRMIGGEETFLEFACGVYVDPANGDIYAINNDTMNYMPVFSRDQKGNVAPKRKIATPHTTAGIVGDDETHEIFLTIQDDHAVVAFDKDGMEDAPVKRVIQGKKTRLADPHGIGLNNKTDEIIVSNWGTTNDRPDFEPGKGGGSFGRGARRTDFPVGRNRAYPASGEIRPPSLTIYPKNAQGDIAPSRVIEGPKTMLDWPTSIAVHAERGEIFVANDTGHTVTVFPMNAHGDVAPIRVISGPKTMVVNPTGVFVDEKNNELWVANFGSHSATVFPIDASGNVTPKRIIRSGPADAGAPMLGNPHTVAYDSKRDEVLVAN
jgi:DNA-binding beta-propeller fold protein YncE